MPSSKSQAGFLSQAIKSAEDLAHSLQSLEPDTLLGRPASPLLRHGENARDQLKRALRVMAPGRHNEVGITLGRSDGIAKFFAFSFAATPRLPLDKLDDRPFWGSGVYAIYYQGVTEPAYKPLRGSETPIYVGKTDPLDPFAESLDDQGRTLWKRLREHANNIGKTNLSRDDFAYRAATVQSGMQAAVEEFMIRLFRPIWNKSVGVCHGLGKHGDSAKTRANKRSPWDTMHPGRKWATDTLENQAERHEIIERVKEHFRQHPPTKTKKQMFEKLALDSNQNG